jgi:hypothetical protein
MTRLVTTGIAALLSVLYWTGPAMAQQPETPAAPPTPTGEFGVKAPVPRPIPGIRLEPTHPPEEQGAREQEFYPGDPVMSRHEPAFVAPMVADVPTSETSSIRVGLSGWTAPRVPFDDRNSTGGVAFGITILWGAPALPPKATQPEPPSQR